MQKRSTEKSVEKKKHLRTSHKACLSERKTVIHAVEDCKTTITYDEEEKKTRDWKRRIYTFIRFRSSSWMQYAFSRETQLAKSFKCSTGELVAKGKGPNIRSAIMRVNRCYGCCCCFGISEKEKNRTKTVIKWARPLKSKTCEIFLSLSHVCCLFASFINNSFNTAREESAPNQRMNEFQREKKNNSNNSKIHANINTLPKCAPKKTLQHTHTLAEWRE